MIIVKYDLELLSTKDM